MNAPIQPKVFIFDLFGVVISFDDTLVYERIARHCVNPAELLEGVKDLVSNNELITGEITLHDIHRWLVSEFALTLDTDQFKKLWLEPYTKSMDSMEPLLASLRKKYNLMLLSNIDAYYWSTVVEQHPEIKHFDKILLSCDLGLAKPEPNIFIRAAEVADTDPSRCFFVDDKPDNIESAERCGFRCHLFTGVNELSRALDKYLE